MTTSLWPETIADDGSLIPATLFGHTLTGPQPHTDYQQDPIGWIVDHLRVPRHTLVWSMNPGYEAHRWDGTPDPLAALLEALAYGESVGVESGTGTGKSFTAACAILWFLACWQGARVFTYAPKEDQLRLYIWAEIAGLWPRFQRHFPTAELSDLRIRMDGTDKWSAHGVAVGIRADEKDGSATKAQGVHAPHMLLVTEETPGIDPSIMRALRNTRTGRHNLQLSLGNPDNQQDTLHKFCELASTTAIRISALDHPNVVTGDDVVPGAASPAGIALIAEEDAPGTPMYDSRVRGISPAEAVDALIKLSWVKAAQARHAALLEAGGARAMGVDVANSEHGDKAAIAVFRGAALESVESKACPNANLLGAEVVARCQDRTAPIAPEYVGIDPVGVGAGTVNECFRLGFHPRRLNGAESPIGSAERAVDGSTMDWAPDANRFSNLRCQMAWQLREDLRKGVIGLPDNPRLARQLTALRFEVKGGKVVIEDKVKAKARIGGKMDDFDAVMYANWVRPRAVSPVTPEVSDDRHPGWDLKARTRKPRRDRSLVPGEGEDLRGNRYSVPFNWRAPGWTGEEEA